jgi:DNA-binding beta-propeller fold protein YncE
MKRLLPRKVSAALVIAVAATACGFAAAAPGKAITYQITKTVPLGAPDRWDYLAFDAQSGRVYITHGDRVSVVDGQSGAVIGSIEGMPGGTHGIAFSHDTGQGFTDDGNAGEAASFDLATLRVTKRIKAEPDADGIIFDRPTGRVFVIDGDSGKLTSIDPKTDTVVATIDGGGGLEFGLSGGNGKLYVNGEEKHEIVRVDAATNKADAHWPMPDCERPHGLAIDTAHARLFSTCLNQKMIVMNSDTGAIVSELPIDRGSDAAGFDSVRQLAFSSNYSGTLSVVREVTPDTFEVLPAIKTVVGARTMTLDPKTGRIYLAAADMVTNPSAAPDDVRHRYEPLPGSLKLYFLDPVTEQGK